MLRYGSEPDLDVTLVDWAQQGTGAVAQIALRGESRTRG